MVDVVKGKKWFCLHCHRFWSWKKSTSIKNTWEQSMQVTMIESKSRNFFTLIDFLMFKKQGARVPVYKNRQKKRNFWLKCSYGIFIQSFSSDSLLAPLYGWKEHITITLKQGFPTFLPSRGTFKKKICLRGRYIFFYKKLHTNFQF